MTISRNIQSKIPKGYLRADSPYSDEEVREFNKMYTKDNNAENVAHDIQYYLDNYKKKK